MDTLIADAAIVVLGLACLRWPQIVWYWKWSWNHKHREPDGFELALGRLIGGFLVVLGIMLAWDIVKLSL